MLKEQILKEFMEIEMEFHHEMMAEGAWCGHVYATEYFSKLRQRALELIDVCLVQYKDCTALLHAARFKLSVDYDELISRVYKLDWEERDSIHIIAEALNDKFKDMLASSMKDLAEFYSLLFGRSFDEYFEAQQAGE